MYAKSTLWRVATIALFAPVVALAEGQWEVSGYLKNESAVFTVDGPVTGQHTTTLDTGAHGAGVLYKSEFTADFFVNYEMEDGSAIHGEFRPVYDPAAISGWKGHQLYSQQDWFRELYLDTRWGDWDVRLGKQQLVWGTADGIKLLDIINPTDYREFSQNTMEDSRIPVWMLRTERPIGEQGNLQFVVSQPKPNVIPGLDASGDRGQPFILLGVDSISGPVNGFLNIAPALGGVATAFTQLALGFEQQNGLPLVGLVPFTGATVNDFALNLGPQAPLFGQACQFYGLAPVASAQCLDAITQAQPTFVNGQFVPGGNNQNRTNLTEDGNWNPGTPIATFEYMPNATFATFNSFVGFDPGGNVVGLSSKFVTDFPSSAKVNAGTRYKNNIGQVFNYSLNYFYHYDPNPSVSIHWEGVNGEPLTVEQRPNPDGNVDVLLRDPTTPAGPTGRYYGAFHPYTGAATGLPPATLVFDETMHRIHSVGASFDTSVDTDYLGPVVLRGEFLYDHGVFVPIINRNALAIGDLVNGLRTEKANMFKYVLGVDVTVLTNLLVSTQLIQFINLDFVDEPGRYTGDQPVLHLSNNLQKGDKYQTFVSLFFSKPFGAAQLHRFNNITIFENGGGYWNRMDVEYGFNDHLIGLAEWNQYWGDVNTTFGQFANSSNFQVGIKYLFD